MGGDWYLHYFSYRYIFLHGMYTIVAEEKSDAVYLAFGISCGYTIRRYNINGSAAASLSFRSNVRATRSPRTSSLGTIKLALASTPVG